MDIPQQKYLIMIKWVKRQMAAFSLATADVERNALGAEAQSLDTNEREEQSHKNATLGD